MPSPEKMGGPPVGVVEGSKARKSWKKVVNGENVESEMLVETTKVVNGVAEVVLPDGFEFDEMPLWEPYLLGYFIGDAPHIGSIHVTVNRLWSSPGKGNKIDVQFLNKSAALFRIENRAVRERVLRRKFWHVGEVPLMMHEWKPETNSMEPDFTSIPVWVDLAGLTADMFSNKGLKLIGGYVGKFVKLHHKTERCLRLDVARMLVEVNLCKPLPSVLSFVYQGRPVRIDVSFPWLPPKCNKWGHLLKSCVGVKFSDVSNEVKDKEEELVTNQQSAIIVADEVTEKAEYNGSAVDIIATLVADLENLKKATTAPAMEVERDPVLSGNGAGICQTTRVNVEKTMSEKNCVVMLEGESSTNNIVNEKIKSA